MIIKIENHELNSFLNRLANYEQNGRSVYALRIEPRLDGVALKINEGEWSATVGTVEVNAPPISAEGFLHLAAEVALRSAPLATNLDDDPATWDQELLRRNVAELVRSTNAMWAYINSTTPKGQ